MTSAGATRASRRSGWVSLFVSLLARTTLGVLVSLLAWALVPTAAGLHATVVMTGSMLPRLVPGDVVFSRTVDPGALQLNQTLLYPDPDQPGHLRMHRWVDVTADGRLVTKGDANPARDSTPIDRSAVIGVASLRVPFVARPVIWVQERRIVPLAATGLALLLLVAAAFWFRAADAPADADAAPDDEGDGDTNDTDDRPTPPTADDADVTHAWPRRLAHSGAALLVVLGLGATFAGTADAAAAKFARGAANPTNSWSAANYFSCSAAVRTDQATLSYPLDETGNTTVANDLGPYNLDGTYTGGYTRTATGGPCGGRYVTLNGSNGQILTPTAAKVQGPNTFTWEIWFKTTAGYAKGGKLMGFDGTQSGTGGQYDRHVYMTNTGQLVFGVYNGAVRTVDSGTAKYNDGKWHLADAVLSPAGLQLYVDGALVDADKTVTTGENYQGWLRIGGGSLGGAWPSVPSSAFFGGSIAYSSAYLLALDANQVAGHYAIGKP